MPQISEYTYPSPEVATEAGTAARSLRPVLTNKRTTQHIAVTAGPGVAAVVPREAFELLLRILAEMAEGNAVTILPLHAELTTQQAAELLNVSRPYLIKLLEERRIPYRLVGTRRRIRFEDLKRYQESEDAKRQMALRELTAEAERLELDF